MGDKDTRPDPTPCILVAVDFSVESARALAVAADLGAALDLPLLLLHVVHDPGHAPGFYLPEKKGPDKKDKKDKKKDKKKSKRTRTIRAAAEDMLREFADEVREAKPHLTRLADARTRLVVGTPAHRIVEVAREETAKMVVMGTRGRSSLGGILLGSNAHRVVQLCDIPVTLVKAKKTAVAAKPAKDQQ